MKFDFVVIGSGLAGLTSALVLQRYGQVLLITKGKIKDTATDLAQGGICAVVEEKDSFESHIKDTLVAGVNHNNKKAVERMVRNAPFAVKWLVSQGVRFDMKNGRFAPTREAAHSHNRVLHASDFTGREIEAALVKKVKSQSNILIWENCFALDLLVKEGKCLGVRALKRSDLVLPSARLNNSLSPTHIGARSFLLEGRTLIDIFSKAVVLTTGGLGQIYEWTTNPKVATGDGLAMAARAGAKLTDLEFVQFHPTAFKSGKSPLFLLSEALRGEGAHLVKSNPPAGGPKSKVDKGERFMEKYDSRGELAPRDIVARAIFAEQQKGNNVFLDIRHKGASFLHRRFPNIYKEVRKRGLNLARDLIPVTPAVHYFCGGVKVDLYGRTNIKNLFAFGEVSCVGAHGANRLASNSLLEATVFPLRLREVIREIEGKRKGSDLSYQGRTLTESVRSSDRRQVKGNQGLTLILMRESLRDLMWEKVGIIRSRQGLKEAKKQIAEWETELRGEGYNRELIELKNMLLVAKLITAAALRRKKSLGAHFIA